MGYYTEMGTYIPVDKEKPKWVKEYLKKFHKSWWVKLKEQITKL